MRLRALSARDIGAIEVHWMIYLTFLREMREFYDKGATIQSPGGGGGLVFLSHFCITCFWRKLLFHTDSAQNYLFQKYSSLEIEWWPPTLNIQIFSGLVGPMKDKDDQVYSKNACLDAVNARAVKGTSHNTIATRPVSLVTMTTCPVSRPCADDYTTE